MDPLSVSASIVGLLSAATAITKSVTGFVGSIKDAPKSTQNVLSEVADIRNCLLQLQSFLLGMNKASASRASLLMVEQILVTLTGCVTTFSELDELLDPVIGVEQSAVDKMKWVSKEKKISKLLLRLQSAKTSLGLMLTTLTCTSIDEARTSSKMLQNLVQQILAENQEMSRRLQTIEMQSKPAHISIDAGRDSICDRPDEDDAMTTRSEIQKASKDQTITETKSFAFTFDHALENSRVYMRNTLRRLNSFSSLPSSTGQSLTWSFLSGVSLTDVTNVSVLSLPLSVQDLWNSNYYQSVVGDIGSKIHGNDKHIKIHEHPVNRQNGKTVSIVLLGDQLSGKTSVTKQFRLLYGDSGFGDQYTLKEREEWSDMIFENIIDAVLRVMEEMGRTMTVDHLIQSHGLPLNNHGGSVVLKALLQTPNSFSEYEQRNLVAEIKDLWKNIERDNENIHYYIKDMERLIEPNYIPSDQDILHLWVKTTGVYTTQYSIKELKYRVTDVGGARPERRKWPLRSYDCVFYMVDLTGYCQRIYVDKNHKGTIGIKEALNLLKSFLQAPDCKLLQKYIALFFTKIDMFEELIDRKPVSRYFPDYTGGSRPEEACDYFASLFRALFPDSFTGMDIFHVNTMDSSSMKAVFDQVHEKMRSRVQQRKPLPKLPELK